MHNNLFSKPILIFLVVIDSTLFVLGFLSADLRVSLLALLLVFLIDRYGRETLLGSGTEKISNAGKRIQITPEQKKEIAASLREQRIAKRNLRREARASKH